MLRALRSLFGKRNDAGAGSRQPESRYAVSVNDAGVACKRPGGKEESIAWPELRQVLIEYSEDPLGLDVWVLLAERGGCVVPVGTDAEEALRKAFAARLPGFNWSAALDAARTRGPVQVWQVAADGTT